ncbi:unnamed protein product [Allacma fusca]|uniref:Uncharacterized protein n=1 Tax=Allacma fusca TaxID=39272 RepID=A0A8J2LRW0_9HEXA|nr:unnamed protein product [Allacma fusca]
MESRIEQSISPNNKHENPSCFSGAYSFSVCSDDHFGGYGRWKMSRQPCPMHCDGTKQVRHHTMCSPRDMLHENL